MMRMNWFRTLAIASITIMVGSCFGATPLPHRGLRIDLSHAGVSKNVVVGTIEHYLQSNHFKYAGKAGYDSLNSTDTVRDFYGPNGISVSIYLDHHGAVLIGMDEDRKCFSRSAESLFGTLENELKGRWPGSVVRTPSHGADCEPK